MHSGPVAIVYRTVLVHWDSTFLIQIEGDKVLQGTRNLLTAGTDSSLKIIVSSNGTVSCQTADDHLERTVELQMPTWNLTLAVVFTDTVWISRQTLQQAEAGSSGPLRPWVEILSLPLSEYRDSPEEGGILATSGLLSGLRQLNPDNCWHLFCLAAFWCSPATYCCSHLLGRLALLAADAGRDYPAEYTKNFVTFSRRFICPAATPFSVGCPPGWQRHNYLCYRLFFQQNVSWDEATSACRGHGAKLVIFSSHGLEANRSVDRSMLANDDELDFVLSLLQKRTRKPPSNQLVIWVGGYQGFPQPSLRLDSRGAFLEAASDEQERRSAADGYLCRMVGCEAGERHCCRLTWEEHLRWERRVLGKAFILRPPQVSGLTDSGGHSGAALEHGLALNLAYGVIGGTVAFVVLYRVITRELEQRRYTARSLTRY